MAKGDFIEMLISAGLKKDTESKIQGEIKELQDKLKPIELKLAVDDSSLKKMQGFIEQINKLDENILKVKREQARESKNALDIEREIELTAKERENREIQISRLRSKASRDFLKMRSDAPDMDFTKLEKSILNLNATMPDFNTSLYKAEEGLRNAKHMSGEFANQTKELQAIIRAEEKASSQAIKEQERDLKSLAREQERATKEMAKNQGKITDLNRVLDRDAMTLRARYGDSLDYTFLEEIQKQAKSLDPEMKNLDRTVKNLKHDLQDFKADARITGESTNVFEKSLGGFSRKLLGFAGMHLGINAIFRELRNGVGVINELDSAITEIAMVTNQAREDVMGLSSDYNKMAKQWGTTTSELTQGAVGFYRQGLDNAEVMERLEYATIYSKVANMDYNESAEILTATMNSMEIGADRVVDTLVYLGDATATSGAEVGRGFARTSGSAKAMGLEFEQVASWIATISAKTREDAGSIGSAINTIITRMANMKEKGFDEEDGTKINEVAKALDKADIELMDSKGNWNDFGEIMDELGMKWGTLDDRTKSYIATTMAGTRRQSQFFNLLENYAESMELYEGAMDSAGTSSEKFETYLESNRAKIDQFKATMEGFWMAVIDSDMLMDFLGLATSFVEKLQEIVEKHGHLIAKTVEWTVKLMALKGVAGLLMKEYTGFTSGDLGKSKVLGLASSLGTVFGWVGKIGSLVLGLPLPIQAIGVAIAGVVGVMKYKDAQMQKEQERLDNLIQSNQEYFDTLDDTDAQVSRFTELSNAQQLDKAEKEELLEIQRELAETYPELVDYVDMEGNSLVTNAENVRELTQAKRELMELELEETFERLSDAIPETQERILELDAEINSLKKSLKDGDTFETQNQYIDNMGNSMKVTTDKTDEMTERLRELIAERKEENLTLAELKAQYSLTEQQADALAESMKWARVEEISMIAVHEENEDAIARMTRELENMGFTSTDVSNILKGNLDEVRERWSMLDEEQLRNLETMETISESQRANAIARITIDKELTNDIIKNISTRIEGYNQELTALSRLAGAWNDTFANIKAPVGWEVNNPFQARADLKQFQIDVEEMKLNKVTKHNQRLDDVLGRVQGLSGTGGGYSPVPGKGGKGGKGNKNKGKANKKAKETQLAELDRYERLNQELERNNALLERNAEMQNRINVLQEQDKDSFHLDKRIALIKEEISLKQKQQDILHRTSQERRKEMNDLEWELKQSGFIFGGEGDNRAIQNLENINGKTKEVEKSFQRYIEIQTKELPKASTEWWKLKNEIDGLNTSMKDLAREDVRRVIEKEKQLAEKDLELRKRASDLELEKLENELESLREETRLYKEEKEKQIKAIEDAEKQKKENEERQKRLEEINNLRNKHYALQNLDLENMSDELAKQLGLESEKEKHIKNQLDMQKQQAKIEELMVKLQNTKRNKNIKQLKKNEDGTYGWDYVADQREIEKIQKEISDAQEKMQEDRENHQKELEKLQEDTHKQLKDAQEKYDEWERINSQNRHLQSLRDDIKRKQDKLKVEEDKFKEKKKITDDAYRVEKENLDKHYDDIDSLVDKRLEKLQKKYNDNWVDINKNLTGHFDTILTNYRQMVAELSRPIEVQSDGSVYIPPAQDNTSWSSGTDWATGGNYGKGSASGQQAKENEKKLRDEQFRLQEIARAREVIENRKRAGMDVTAQLKYLDRLTSGSYAHGGKITQTGKFLVDLHGQNSSPEWIFNDDQLRKVVHDTTIKASEVAQKGTGGGNVYHIGKLEFPNVEKSNEIEDALSNLSVKVDQWVGKRK